jgi:hypothetical protein
MNVVKTSNTHNKLLVVLSIQHLSTMRIQHCAYLGDKVHLYSSQRRFRLKSAQITIGSKYKMRLKGEKLTTQGLVPILDIMGLIWALCISLLFVFLCTLFHCITCARKYVCKHFLISLWILGQHHFNNISPLLASWTILKIKSIWPNLVISPILVQCLCRRKIWLITQNHMTL